MPQFFNHIMLREEQDIPNWILDESVCFSFKSDKIFFLGPRSSIYSWGKFIWSSSILTSKTLVLWKVFYGRLPTNQHRSLHICSMCTLCVKHKESIQHLFF